MSMKPLKSLKGDSISSEQERTYFQTYVFDAYKYTSYFETNSQEIKGKLIDALWPFLPENQHFQADNEIQYKQGTKVELYGPLWIIITLIIEFSILGHLQSVNLLTPPDATSMAKTANVNVHQVFRIAFLLSLYFFFSPFVSYLLFKAKGAFEVTFTQLFMITTYSFAIFVPVSVLYVFVPFYRFRWFLLLVSTAMSLYYMYKEVRELITKYFDWESFKNLAWFACGCSGVFMLFVKYQVFSA